MIDYTGAFEKIAGANLELYKFAQSNSEMLWEQLNTQGKRAIDTNAREASRRLDRGRGRDIRSSIFNRMRAVKSPTPRRSELGRDLVRGSSDLMKRKGMIPTASQNFKNPAFAAANASHVPSMSGIISNAAKRKLFK